MRRDSARSPFGSLLDEIREEKARASGPHAAPVRATGPAPELHIEAGVVSGASDRAGSPRRWRWAAAAGVHAALGAAVLVAPLLMPQDLPAPAVANRLFVVASLAAPLPPPPPPVARSAAPAVARKDAVRPTATPIAPVVVPDAPPAPLDLAPPAPPASMADEGVPGGVEEGVPGGIVGGILQPARREEAPYAPRQARAGIDVKEPRKLRNVAPVYPDAAARGKVEGVVILELGIRPDGRVDDVRVLRSLPVFDEAAVKAARQWVFTPTLIDGVPVSVIMTVSVRFSLTQQAAAS